jgi:hypothetical protein
MEYYLTLEHWNALVRHMKDSEREFDVTAYKTEQLAKDILRVIRGSRLRQALLFKEHRGEEYEKFVKKLNLDYEPDAVARALKNEEFWEACFSLREV